METIFDYNPTSEELQWLSGSFNKEQYLHVITHDGALSDLATLFALRLNDKRSREYANKILDRGYVMFTLQNHDLIPPSKSSKITTSALMLPKAA